MSPGDQQDHPAPQQGLSRRVAQVRILSITPRVGVCTELYPERADIDCNTQLHAGDRNSHSPEPAGIIFPGGISSRGAASFGLEGRSIWHGSARSAAPLPPGAVQVGKGPESLNERRSVW